MLWGIAITTLYMTMASPGGVLLKFYLDKDISEIHVWDSVLSPYR